jgi:hypothetical protein
MAVERIILRLALPVLFLFRYFKKFTISKFTFFQCNAVKEENALNVCWKIAVHEGLQNLMK